MGRLFVRFKAPKLLQRRLLASLLPLHVWSTLSRSMLALSEVFGKCLPIPNTDEKHALEFCLPSDADPWSGLLSGREGHRANRTHSTGANVSFGTASGDRRNVDLREIHNVTISDFEAQIPRQMLAQALHFCRRLCVHLS